MTPQSLNGKGYDSHVPLNIPKDRKSLIPCKRFSFSLGHRFLSPSLSINQVMTKTLGWKKTSEHVLHNPPTMATESQEKHSGRETSGPGRRGWVQLLISFFLSRNVMFFQRGPLRVLNHFSSVLGHRQWLGGWQGSVLFLTRERPICVSMTRRRVARCPGLQYKAPRSGQASCEHSRSIFEERQNQVKACYSSVPGYSFVKSEQW